MDSNYKIQITLWKRWFLKLLGVMNYVSLFRVRIVSKIKQKNELKVNDTSKIETGEFRRLKRPNETMRGITASSCEHWSKEKNVWWKSGLRTIGKYILTIHNFQEFSLTETQRKLVSTVLRVSVDFLLFITSLNFYETNG